MKKIAIISLAILIVALPLSGCVKTDNTPVSDESVPSTEAVSVFTTEEPEIAVDGTEFKNKYYDEIKGKYVKNNNKEHDLLIDELYAEIDEFYNSVKTGVTQSEYDAYEASVNALISKLESSSEAVNATITKEELIIKIENQLIVEINTKLLQIDYSQRQDISKAERKAPFEELLEKAEALIDDVNNGTVSVEEGEKLCNKLTREYYSTQQIY